MRAEPRTEVKQASAFAIGDERPYCVSRYSRPEEAHSHILHTACKSCTMPACLKAACQQQLMAWGVRTADVSWTAAQPPFAMSRGLESRQPAAIHVEDRICCRLLEHRCC